MYSSPPTFTSRALTTIVLLLALASSPTEACTVFALVGDVPCVGAHLDWEPWFPGDVIVNPSGVWKTALLWQEGVPVDEDTTVLAWASSYRSITFTCYGRDFVEGGMNEAGLVVEQANLGSSGSTRTIGRGVSCAQWIQYQLDTAATVEEVLSQLDDLPEGFEGWHYLIADRLGAVAVLEFCDGRARAYTGEELSYPIITNTEWTKAASTVPLDRRFGGTADIAAGDDSYGRFVRVAEAMRERPNAEEGAAGRVFRILDTVSLGDTQRRVAYDIAGGRVYWRSALNPELRWLDFSGIEERECILRINVDSPGSGCLDRNLATYSEARNREIAAAAWPAAHGPVTEQSSVRSVHAIAEMIALHPTADRTEPRATNQSRPGPGSR